ncbi:MAG: beta-Ala-His dipeptidase [Capsulimonadaceae bacterium]
MNEAFAGLEPVDLWRHFDALTQIRRPSHGEQAAMDYVRTVAHSSGCTWRTDAAGNCVVYVPNRVGQGAGKPVAVQAHVDMVEAVAEGVEHDWTRDRIRVRRLGDWIAATGTTLGADNGIGAAACLALITDLSLPTGPLEVIFTTGEEIGLLGASALDPSLVTATTLLNLDSEDPDSVTIGCAGGETDLLTLPANRSSVAPGMQLVEVCISGGLGGHSGVEIHQRRVNAIKLLASLLREARWEGIDYRLVSMAGGSAHNAIPGAASAHLTTSPSATARLMHAANSRLARERALWGTDDPNLTIVVNKTGREPVDAVDIRDSDRLLTLLEALPTGVTTMSRVFDGKVQTSDNVATVATTEAEFQVVVSLRSFVGADISALRDQVAGFTREAGGTLCVQSAYPNWEPRAQSHLLRVVEAEFRELNGRPPIVEVVHAGLECGVISAKVPGMDAISFGPRLEAIHTADERVDTTTVPQVWNLLTRVLTRLGQEG